MKARGRAGFTLVEAMVVLAIMALMAGIAVPALLDAVPGMRASGATRQVLSDLRLARTQTIETGVNVGVIFHPSSLSYVIFRDNGSTADAYDADDTVERTVSMATDFKGVRFGSTKPLSGAAADGVDLNGDTVVFHTNGSANGGGYVYLVAGTDNTRADRNRRIVITAPTGGAVTEVAW